MSSFFKTTKFLVFTKRFSIQCKIFKSFKPLIIVLTMRKTFSSPTHKRSSRSGQKLEGFRKKSIPLKTAKGRKNSSQKWLQRQLNDPYVQKAHQQGYRSRAAFKLLEIQQKFRLIHPNSFIVDLGAAPGGWSQIAAQIIQIAKGSGKIFALDLLEMDAIAGVAFVQGDFLLKENKEKLKSLLSQNIDLVLSDMAAPTTGHSMTDHLRTRVLSEEAFFFAKEILKPGGAFVTKVFAGGTHKELLDLLKRYFQTVKHFKPPASRKESPEIYVVCLGFRP